MPLAAVLLINIRTCTVALELYLFFKLLRVIKDAKLTSTFVLVYTQLLLSPPLSESLSLSAKLARKLRRILDKVFPLDVGS